MKIASCIGVAGVSLGALGVASTATASVIAYDNINYSTGSINGASGGGGFGANNWAVGGTTSGNGNVTGTAIATPAGTNESSSNSVEVAGSSGGGAGVLTRTLAATITTSSLSALGDPSGTLFFSVLTQHVDLNGFTSALYMEGTVNGTSPLNGVAAIGLFNNSHADWAANSGANSTFGPSTYAPTTSATLLVGSVNLSSGVIDLYVNPQGTTMPASPDGTVTITGIGTGITVSSIELLASGSGTAAYNTNLTLGTTFADVVSAPEPSTLALLGLPALALLTRRRRAGV